MSPPFLYRRNIYSLYLIKLSKWLMLIMPIVALFYSENGLSEGSIYLLQTVYSLSLAIMEIPSGYLADIWGRRKSLILGSFLGTFGFVLYSCSSTVFGFIVAEIILGLGGSCISGSDTAILFDTLDSVGRKEEYLRFEGRITATGNFAETFAAILGGFIAFWCSYRAVYVVQTLIAATAIPASLLLQEPPTVEKGRETMKGYGFRHILSICHYALFENRPLSASILQSAITGITTLSMAWTAQIYFVAQGFTEIMITPLWVSLNLIVALVSGWASLLERLIRPKYGLLIIVLAPCGYILLGVLPVFVAICSLFLFYAVRGYATPILKNYTNLYCESNVRATVFSIRSLMIRFGFAVFAGLVAYITEETSFAEALLYMGYILLIVSFCSGIFLYRNLDFLKI